MTDKPTKPSVQPKADEIKDLPPKTVSPKDADKTKGGRAGPGTQTEDEVYIGCSRCSVAMRGAGNTPAPRACMTEYDASVSSSSAARCRSRTRS